MKANTSGKTICTSTEPSNWESNGYTRCYIASPTPLTDLDPCDFAEILEDGSMPELPCSITSFCKCYGGDSPPNSDDWPTPGCGGNIHANSSNGKNITYLLENITIQYEPFCGDVQWDGACMSLAQSFGYNSTDLNYTSDEKDDIKRVMGPISEYEVSNSAINPSFTNNWDCQGLLATTDPEKSCVESQYFDSNYRWTNNCVASLNAYANGSCKYYLLRGDCTNCCCPYSGCFQFPTQPSCRTTCFQ